MKGLDRREFLRLAGLGGVVFASALAGPALAAGQKTGADDFFFVQISDVHWGFNGPAVNPDPLGTLPKAIAAVNSLTHRPLFDLYPQWDWATRDGAKAVELLLPYPNVTVLYGHIHQEHHHLTGHIPHHAAMGMMFSLPAPGSQPKRAAIPWDPAAPYRGLGFREVAAKNGQTAYDLTEVPLQKG